LAEVHFKLLVVVYTPPDGVLMRSIFQVFGLLWKSLRHLFRYRKARQQIQTAQDKLRVLDAVMTAYRKCDYEGALAAADAFRDADDEAAYSFYRGSMLMHLGRLQEAEGFQRRNVRLQSDPKRSALSYSMLGQNLQEQQRYDEAMECFEAALRRSPGKGSVHRHMAELHLHHGCPSEALKWANLAVEEERRTTADSPGMERVNRLNLAEALAAQAWALAVVSRNSEKVEQLVAEALPLIDPDYMPSMAQARYHFGQAFAALGNADRAVEHFEAAARIDAKGTWGRSAAVQLAGTCK
jgi:tetratricopeptide (TPR) repeat protein